MVYVNVELGNFGSSDVMNNSVSSATSPSEESETKSYQKPSQGKDNDKHIHHPISSGQDSKVNKLLEILLHQN